MSELKSYDLVDIQDYRGEVYIKSEADKVIARHKYKRCLAMARWCTAERDIFNLTPKFAKVKFYRKWHKRWLELAEKFKEAK